MLEKIQKTMKYLLLLISVGGSSTGKICHSNISHHGHSHGGVHSHHLSPLVVDDDAGDNNQVELMISEIKISKDLCNDINILL